MKAPLADRIRPQCIEDMVGQSHLLSEGKALRNIIESEEIPNLIFYGPSGVGKTTLASIIAKKTNRKFHKLNGTSASTADIRAIVGELDTLAAPNGILLYLDEIQYFNKKQQQTLLDYIERGEIILIASTTENPYFYVHGAVLSRSTVFEFKSITAEEIVPGVKKAFDFLSAERNITVEADDAVLLHIARSCGGDVRKAMNSAELCVLSTIPDENGRVVITKEKAEELTQKSAMKYDREGDEHYDILSGFQKSMRGSDADAALHYLARLLEAGDMPSAIRRLLVCANEDVGLAYPMIIPIVKAAVDTALMVGMPEARIPLSNAVVLVCNSPKSNSAYLAFDAAMADVKSGNSGPIPRQLQNKHYDGEDNNNKGQFYKYPHDYPNHYVPQQYLPDKIKNRKYYVFGDNKNEQAAKEYWEKVKNKKQ
ncbi:MAG: replication-associated recombination protein A [Acutalibacteraceae bacterium]|nr:replication-associated recombination protein A [Acutalibacteraceae bacterium]